MASRAFKYDLAFSRNIGLLTEEEQQKLRTFTVAIPGMGGVGGVHLISLVRQGFEKFRIADMDEYEIKNFNRQYGARLDTLERQKVEVMKEEALKINPDCQIEVFAQGVNPENVDQFVKGADLCVDALDAFALDARRLFFKKAEECNIPIITAGPIGFGTAYLIFMPGGPTFDQYFAIEDKLNLDQKILHFLVGLVPSLLQLRYMKGTNLKEKRGPSSIGAVNLCAGVVAISALKILLSKGKVKAVPYYHQFDVMENRFVVKRLWFGNKNPIQKIKLILAKYLVKD